MAAWGSPEYDRELSRRILQKNLERNYPQLGRAEQDRALNIAEVAFSGQTSNGEASRIGAESVLRERDTGR
jgi:hypothetical protein